MRKHPKLLGDIFIRYYCPIDFHVTFWTPWTISWSWYSSPNYFMARAFLRVRFHNTHESYVCRAKCRMCGTVKSELGQWMRMNIGCARLKRNLDFIKRLPLSLSARTALGCAHSCASKLKIDCPVHFEAQRLSQIWLLIFNKSSFFRIVDEWYKTTKEWDRMKQ